MIRRTDIEIQKAAMLKAARAAIRLKHSLEADREIAEVLPTLEERINEALASGAAFELEPGELFHVD